MQRSATAQPVLRGDRGGAARLHDVDGGIVVQDRDVHRLAQFVGEFPAHRGALLGDVQAYGRRPRQAQDARPEEVLAAVLGLRDQAPVLQHAEQPERRGLVHVQLVGDVGDARLAAPGEDLQHAHGAVHGLDRPRPRLGRPVLRFLVLFSHCLVAGHSSTLAIVRSIGYTGGHPSSGSP